MVAAASCPTLARAQGWGTLVRLWVGETWYLGHPPASTVGRATSQMREVAHPQLFFLGQKKLDLYA